MPVYEYRCADCNAVSSRLVYSWSSSSPVECRQCGGSDLSRLMSGFAIRKSWGDSLNWVPSRETSSDVDENNPASINRYMGRIKSEMGGQTTPDFDQMRREIGGGSGESRE